MSLIHEMMRFGKFVGGGVSSWNDLTDKPFYSEPGEVLPETTVEIDPEMGMAALPDMSIHAGDECTIKYNGTEYVCKCVDMGGGVLALGNSGVLDEENPVDTGEPFVLAKVDSGAGALMWTVVPLDGSTSVTLSIIGQVHHPVPDKYLPYKIVDINISTNESSSGEIIYVPDMQYSLVREYALMPQTLVRCIVNAGTDKAFFNLYDITDGCVGFKRFCIDIGDKVVEEMIVLYADGRCAYMKNHA
jgi:hypothetical protein